MSNTKYRNDFSYVAEHVAAFFDRTSVRNALNRISDLEITGWEKWWQVEFVTWLAEHQNVGDWVMEEPFSVDGRGRLSEKLVTMSIDIGFRLRAYSTREFLFLELKQDYDWRRCINRMLTDVQKVYGAKKRSTANGIMIRNFFVVGVHPIWETSKAEVKDYVEARCERAGVDVQRDQILSKVIRGTPFGVTVF